MDQLIEPSRDEAFELDRFLLAQERVYSQALQEIRAARKQSHWMWFIFPQFAGLGFSSMSQRYAIHSLQEAKAYLEHPTLGPRLIECAEALLLFDGKSALQIMGSPDDLKLHSSATLFALISPPNSVFHQLLDKYFQGQPDDQTLRLTALPPAAK